ncbi:MAG: TIGR03619 family F420-dependent LLM class oxidoreductase [Dehalococcoidia bacterium]|nr:TIGR03619 family F420-dependent LLM class oxidoreductase [Dehalococcoidia bacterium]
MKIGVKIGPALGPEVGRAAIEAERIGFDSVWLSERVVTPLDRPHPYEPMVDPWIALAYVAAVTARVRLGTSVSQIALRSPVLMARECITLDRLSEGRLIVGAGAGWVIEEFQAAGVGFEDRGGRLNEVIRVLKHLFTQPGAPWHGRYFELPAAGIVTPRTPGGPPIWVGGLTPAGLRRAARLSDGFLALARTPEDLAKVRGELLALRERAGRSGHYPVWTQTAPPENIGDAKAMARAWRAAGADGLILTYAGGAPDGYLAREDVARALIESAA